MKPKGWKLDPAWVEHYSKIDRLEAEIAHWKKMYECAQNANALRASALGETESEWKPKKWPEGKWWIDGVGSV